MKLNCYLGGVIDGSASQQGSPSNLATNTNEASSSTSGDTTDDDGFSQAESSIKNGEVIASAQGNKIKKQILKTLLLQISCYL